jgi:hypothetical protein
LEARFGITITPIITLGPNPFTVIRPLLLVIIGRLKGSGFLRFMIRYGFQGIVTGGVNGCPEDGKKG